MIISNCIHVPSNGIISFIFMTEFHNFILPLVDGHVGCFHVLAVGNSASVKVGVHISF